MRVVELQVLLLLPLLWVLLQLLFVLLLVLGDVLLQMLTPQSMWLGCRCRC